MTKSWKWRLVPLLLAVVLVAAATACSKASEKHWPHNTAGRQVLVNVWIPASTVVEANNDTPFFRAAVQNAVDQWNPHPDLHFRLLPAGSPCGAIQSGVVQNCFQAWRVSPTVANPVPGFTAPACWPDCAFSWIWGTGGTGPHRLNTNLQAPPNQDWSRIIIPTDWETEPWYQNVPCHEEGHAIGLEHHDPVTADWDQNPETPDTTQTPEGPCVNAVPDRDTDPSNGEARGWDWSEVDVNINRCHVDTGSHPGTLRDTSEPEVSTASDTTNCAGAQAFSAEGPLPPPEPVVTTEEQFEEQFEAAG